MCGRYALALRPQQVRAYLEDANMPVYDAPEDDADGGPRQSYNFAPGYYGLVYRADTADHGGGPQQHEKGEGQSTEQDTNAAPEPASPEPTAPKPTAEQGEVRYKLQSMKWGLIPFWTKRNPDYGSMMKTINCRDDSLIENKGMWTSMKQKKRCVIVFQGFYEWLKKGKEKVPHYIKRKDGQLMCVAGLWDCVQYEGSDDKHYTYTIITTDSNKQLNFLHDRMPVVFENGSEEMRTWLDPGRHTWSKELQSLLKPYDGELEVYAVSKDVGKVGNNSPNFIIPVASSENKSNIANFFAKGTVKKETKVAKAGSEENTTKEEELKKEELKKEDLKKEDMQKEDSKQDVKEDAENEVKEENTPTPIKHEEGEDRETVDHNGSEDNAPLPVPKEEAKQGIKREFEDVPDAPGEQPPKKVPKTSANPSKAASPTKSTRKTRSATSNNTASPSKETGKDKGSQKITNFFGK